VAKAKLAKRRDQTLELEDEEKASIGVEVVFLLTFQPAEGCCPIWVLQSVGLAELRLLFHSSDLVYSEIVLLNLLVVLYNLIA